MTKPAPGPDQPPIPVRLVTFNIHHAVGEDGRLDLPRVARALADTDADVICLQEVDRHYGDRSGDADQALLLSQALDMQLAWGPAIDEPGPDGRPRQYGNAVLSRLPILISDVHPLPGGGEQRIALRTMIELDGGTLWVIGTHLTTGPAADRAAQVAAMAALHTDTMGAGVLAGDVNARPDAPELGVLRERFADAWTVAGRRADGCWSWHRATGDTYPARSPNRRIDQVWLSAGVTATAAHVMPDEGASDHLPLVVDLAVESGV